MYMYVYVYTPSSLSHLTLYLIAICSEENEQKYAWKCPLQNGTNLVSGIDYFIIDKKTRLFE